VKLLYDIYHMQIMEGDLIRTIRDNIEWIGHFHTAETRAATRWTRRRRSTTGVARALAETCYGGYVGHEFISKGERSPQ